MDVDSTNTAPPAPSLEQRQQLRELIGGYRVSQAIYVVVKLGIPDLVKDGPKNSDELARLTETHEPSLYRVLRFLAGVGLFTEAAPRRFALTPLGAGLLGGLWAPMLLGEAVWQAWGHLLHTVQTGEIAFDHVHGQNFFKYLAEDPDATVRYQEGMASSVARSGSAITEVYDFSDVERLVDIGGGHGALLATILRAHPTLKGVLFDRPVVVVGAATVLETAGVAERCAIVAGDFFEAVPPQGDVYLLRQIIHDWDNAKALTILRNCRRAMQKTGRLLVIEKVIGDDAHQALPTMHTDMEMLVLNGGLQRTEADYDALFTEARFRMTRVVPLNDVDQSSVFEGRPT